MRPYDWGRLPSLSRASAEQARRAAALFAGALVVEGLALTATLRGVAPLVWEHAPPHALVIPLVGGPAPAALILDPALVAALAARLLGDDAPELVAPRPATLVERGVAAVAAAALLEDSSPGSAWRVGEPVDVAGARGLFATPPLAAELSVDVAGRRGVALLAGDAPVRRSAGRVVAGVPVALRAVLAATQVAARDLLALAVRDVVRFSGPARLRLAVARGGFAAEAAWRDTQGPLDVRLIRGYQREGANMDADLAADLPVELTLELGRVTLSTAEAMALAPGAVVTVPRPVGGLVEVAAGGRVIARGELVDVDGALGVRVVELV